MTIAPHIPHLSAEGTPRADRSRRVYRLVVPLAVLAAACLTGCSAISIPPVPDTCDDVTTLFAVADALADPTNACFEWVDATQGRVARSGSASAVVWSRRTTAGPALLVSAMHTLGAGWFEPAGSDTIERLRDPGEGTGVPRIYLIEPTGGAPDDQVTPLFNFYNPEIPAEENTNGLRDILPVHDFYVGVIDNQKHTIDLVAPAVDPLQDAAPDVYDPDAHTTTAPTYTSVDPDDLVLLMGYPKAAPFSGVQTANVGRVLSDAAASAAIVDLADAGDVEGDIAYNAEVEMIIMGHALGGMSGGGVFDEDGILVGIIVRASDERGGVQYVRAVRMTYVVGKLLAAFDALPADEKEAVRPYLEQDVP